jgi:hypothetical protein
MSKTLIVALALVLVLAAVIGFFLFKPMNLSQGFYSCINENRAKLADNEFIRDVTVNSDGSGWLTTVDSIGNPVDIIKFKSFSVGASLISFKNLDFYKNDTNRNYDGEGNLSLSFSMKNGGFVMGDCHYEYIPAN